MSLSCESTPAGIPIIDCATCGHRHPISCEHCPRCGLAHLFECERRPIVDLFAGPGGWDEGLRMLGITDVLGVEWDKAACATAEAAGHARVCADVAALNPRDFFPCVGVIASPPCQAWSMAGKRLGELDRAHCHELADRMAAGDDSLDWCEWEDERSPLVCQPIRWARELRPEWIALEEVPQVASLWEHFARILRGWGYSVWTGDLNAADFGVPQTRKRRILIASRVRTVHPPQPTHSEHAHGDDLLGGTTLPWVSMAEALGIDPEELIGFPRRADTASNRSSGVVTIDGNEYRARDLFPGDGPSQTVTEKTRSWQRFTDTTSPKAEAEGRWDVREGERPPVLVNGNQPNAGRRSADEPAPTVLFGHRSNDVRWVGIRPSTTVTSRNAVAKPGHRDRSGDERKFEGSVRVTVQEAAILQSFPADYPWQGSRTKQYEQVGNAIPPLLAAHVLAAVMGIAVDAEAAA